MKKFKVDSVSYYSKDQFNRKQDKTRILPYIRMYICTYVRTYLHPEGVGWFVSFEEVIGAPPDCSQGLFELVRGDRLLLELDHAPRKHRHRERHREPKLDVIAGVVVSSDQVHLPRECDTSFSTFKLLFEYFFLGLASETTTLF